MIPYRSSMISKGENRQRSDARSARLLHSRPFFCSMHTRLGTVRTEHVVPKQRKLMGSSAQNSSGVHWCRRRVRFNEVPEKVPKVPARSGSTGFRKPSQVQQGSGEGSGEGSGGGRGGFGAEPGQVQQGSGEGSGEGL